MAALRRALRARANKADAVQRQAVFDACLANLQHINNWDLVDTSAPQIVGAHLDPTDFTSLEALARSDDQHWETMPRTAVRYAIEKFTPATRRKYMR